MSTLHRLIAGTVLALLVGPLLLVAPAHADDPIPGAETDPCGIVWRDREIAYWQAATAEAREDATVRELRATDRALRAEDRVATLTADVAARTHERDRLLVRTSRLVARAARLQAKVDRLRAQLHGGLVG